MLMSTLPIPARPEALNTTSADVKAFAFERLLSEAQNAKTWQFERDYALDHGVNKIALEKYVSGACSLYEREEIQGVLLKSKWAMDYVINLVKSRRSALP